MWHAHPVATTDEGPRAARPVLAAIRSGSPPPVVLVAGDLVLAEPVGEAIGSALEQRLTAAAGGDLAIVRRPEDPGRLFDDLSTYAMFGGGKVRVAIDTGLLAGAGHVAELIAEARGAAVAAGGELTGKARSAALSLLRALRLQGVDPFGASPEEVLASLPDALLSGGRRSAKAAASAREELAPLLAGAAASGLVGRGEGAEERLAALLAGGLPRDHHLVLVERTVDRAHPLLEAIRGSGALVEVASVESGRDGAWSGLAELAAELEQQTRVGIDPDALDELARRTLRPADRRSAEGARSDTTSRFAAEYRKLATLAGAGRIRRQAVAANTSDRGEEDVWKILDAIADGRPSEALGRLRRRLEAAPDRMAERLTILSLLSSFCRQLIALRGALDLLGVASVDRAYSRFRDQQAPRLQGELPGVAHNPLRGLHPFRLHRAALAAANLDRSRAAALPWRLLEVELALKGESGTPEIALSSFVAELAAPRAAAGGQRAPARRAAR